MKWLSSGYQIFIKNGDKKIFSDRDLDDAIKKYIFCDFSDYLNQDHETSVEFLNNPSNPNESEGADYLKSVKLNTETTTLTRQTQTAQHETHEPEGEQKRAETTIAAPMKEPEGRAGTAAPMKHETPAKTEPVKAQTESKKRTEVDRYLAITSPLPEERALGDFVIVLYSDGAKEYVCPRCGSRFNTVETAAEHKQKGCAQKPEQAAYKPATAPMPEPTAAPQPQNAPTTEQISTQTSTPTQTTQTSTETHGAEKNGEQSAEQSAGQKEFEEKLRAKIANGKPACADGEQMKYDVVASNHGKCTGFYAQDGALPELVKYGNKLYVFHCEDGAVAFVCSICRTGFTTLQGFEIHAKETHGWEFY